jgi:Ca-activated chloride channel homolog
MKRTIKAMKDPKLNCKNWLAEAAYQMVQHKLKIRTIALILLFFILLSNAKAQDENDDTPIKVDTLLFTIPLTVSDEKGRNIPGLKKENFSIYQDGDEQEIELFFNEEAPMNVAILLDTSYSTKEVLDNIQKAARDFVKILRPQDKAVIVSFDHRTLFLSGLTSERKLLSKAIDQAHISEVNGSEMYNAVTLVVQNYFASLKGRKAIIALTDGVVTGRGISAQQILDMLQQSDTVFYPIIFKTDFYSSKKSGTKRPPLVKFLEIFAEETAGRFYEKEATKLKEAFQSIAEELKKQYLLGFYPQNSESGKSSGYIRVDVDRKGLTVRAKKRLKL